MSLAIIPTGTEADTEHLACFRCGHAIVDVYDVIDADNDTLIEASALVKAGVVLGALPVQVAHSTCKTNGDADVAKSNRDTAREHNISVFKAAGYVVKNDRTLKPIKLADVKATTTKATATTAATATVAEPATKAATAKVDPTVKATEPATKAATIGNASIADIRNAVAVDASTLAALDTIPHAVKSLVVADIVTVNGKSFVCLRDNVVPSSR